ncbi:hypothetical protein C8J56DRAFT_950043 [Mycena floridula]|nr:hypothetical protein C8J56DRAFT_950043 [Mycena floridula]
MAATFAFKLSDWAFPIAHTFNTIEEIDLEYGHYDGYNTLLAVMAMFLSVKGKTYLTTAPQQWLVARHAANLLAHSVLGNAAKRDTSASTTAAAEPEVSSSVGGDTSGAGPDLAEASIASSFIPESEEAELSILLDELSIVREDFDGDEDNDENDDDVVENSPDSSDVSIPRHAIFLRPRETAPSSSSSGSPDPSFDNSALDSNYEPSTDGGSNESSFDDGYRMFEVDPLQEWDDQAQATSTPNDAARVAPKISTPLSKIGHRLKRTAHGTRVEQSLKERHVVPDSLTNVSRFINGLWAKTFPGMIQEVKPYNWHRHRQDPVRQSTQYRLAFNRAVSQLMVQGLLSFYNNDDIQKIFGMLLIGKRFRLFLFKRPTSDLIGPADLPKLSDLNEIEAFANGPFQGHCSQLLMEGEDGIGNPIFADLHDLFSSDDDFSQEWRQVWRTFDTEFALGLNLNNL